MMARETWAPNLPDSERLRYLEDEHEFLEEILDGAEDCKLIYHALINCAILASNIRGTMSRETRQHVLSWLGEVEKLDPLRHGRWVDFEKALRK